MNPLAGIKILDLTRVLAGPFATRMLNDLGADVVKVEPPEGDVTRHFGTRLGHQTGYFAQFNAGKRAICVDFTQPEGPELIRNLAKLADVVIENFRPGVLAKFGLDWPQLSTEHPELIMVSISGFGQTGPESHRPAYAGIIHAESGWISRQAKVASAHPTDSQLSVADTTSGLHSLVAMFAALRERDQTGIGQHIDIAMIEALLTVDDYFFWALEGVENHPRGGGEIWNAPGGPLMIMGDFKWVWKCATEILELRDPSPKGCSLEEKIEGRRKAWEEYLLSFKTRPPLLSALNRANLAWGDVKTAREAITSPTLTHRESLVEIDDRRGGTRRVVQSPYRFSQSESQVRGPAPLKGEHNYEVLTEWVGMSEKDIRNLTEAGVLIEESTGD